MSHKDERLYVISLQLENGTFIDINNRMSSNETAEAFQRFWKGSNLPTYARERAAKPEEAEMPVSRPRRKEKNRRVR